MESTSRKYPSVDTNIILRLILRDDEELTRCARDLVLNGNDYYVDDYAVMEAVYVLTKRQYSRDEICEVLQGLLANSMFIYNEQFFTPVFERYLTHPSLAFNDCVLEARAMLSEHIPLYTFDRKLAHQSPIAELVA